MIKKLAKSTPEMNIPKLPPLERAMLIIEHELKYAQKKHPTFPSNRSDAMSIIGEEYGEACQINNDIRNCVIPYDDGIAKYIQENAHIAVTAIRSIASEIEKMDKEDKKAKSKGK